MSLRIISNQLGGDQALRFGAHGTTVKAYKRERGS
jgi:hypothetical protein